MKPTERSLEQLLAAARRAPRPAADEAAPSGFATRVAAQAFERLEVGSMFGRLALRAAAVAALLAVATVAANFTSIRGALDDNAPVAANPANPDDPVSEVVDLGS